MEQADKWQDEEALEKIFWVGYHSNLLNQRGYRK